MADTFTAADARRCCTAAVQAAQAGGAVLQEWIGRFSVREKSRANLVTEADEASQSVIVDSLKRQFPNHGFLAEENLDQSTGDDQPRWIIDPLDGTSNYVHGFPYYAVSIALYAAGRLQTGVIFDPTRNETFSAVAGGGAYLGQQKLTTSGAEDLADAMAMASLPIAAPPEDPAIRRFLQGLGKLQTVQRSGSAALNLAYVAAGRIDAFWSSSLHAWDVAAGVLLIQEAGGSITGLKGDAIDIFQPSLLAASTEKLRQDLLTVLA
jgi:myo-inositol-1(or 4)-monophosphatase